MTSSIFAIREHRLPTIVAGQSGSEYWAQILTDRVAADSIVNHLANGARKINHGNVDMRKANSTEPKKDDDTYWE